MAKVKKMDKIEKIKTLLNKNIERRPTFGTDPNEPWSVRAGITESEGNLLDRYLMARGINPKFISKYTRISHAKSSSFLQWKKDHMYEEVDVEEMKTLNYTPVELRQLALDKSKQMTKVIKHNGLHEEENDTVEKNEMVQAQLHFIKYACEEILDYIDKGGKVEEWYQVKIAKSFSEFESLHSFMEGESRRLGIKEDTEQLDELSPSTLASYVLKTSGKDPKRADPRKKAMSKLAKTMAKQPVDKNAPRYLPMGEAKTIQGTALDKFRQAAAERAKKHAEIDKEMKIRHAAGKEDMKGAIDRLEKHLNKEEAEQIDEISKSTLDSYKDKSSASLKNAQTNRDAAEPGKNMSKGFADLHAKSNAIAKKRVKGLMGYLQRKQGVKPMSEDVFQDTYAATQTAFDMGTQADDREPTYSKRKEMSKSARMIKSLYKKHKMVKEDLYDHEKEDKSVATYGKKPKVEKQEVYGDDDTQAAMVLKGGKTLTGQTRDTLEIDPVMRKANKNNDNQT